MIRGFVYVPDADPGPMAGAAPGRRVTLPAPRPPWIVVQRSLEGLPIWRWPGRLWRVEVVEPDTAEARAAIARADGELPPSASYTRAAAVRVVEEIPVATVFGPHGGRVAEVIDAAKDLTQDDAERLAAARHPHTASAYGAAWDRWLATQPNPGPYLGDAHEGVLRIPGAGPSGSPVGSGLSAVSHAVHESARLRGRPGVEVVEDDGETEEMLAGAWHGACLALLGAALAVGAPHLLDEDESAALTAAWSRWRRRPRED
ncbi:hypothetical protein [Actinomadura miaoliensis]|uniref:ADP-ribosylglycohydrolase family protein n=1 Tax=Actinomadura miaoliensis TaxID=430685 RepID=A0ABP7WVG9_9ACTN